jgi:hypothetical protein
MWFRYIINYDSRKHKSFTKFFCEGLKSSESDFSRVWRECLADFAWEVDALRKCRHNNRTRLKGRAGDSRNANTFAGNFESNRSYSNVFLAHDSLYVLGGFWLSDTLKALVLHKLHKTLCIPYYLSYNIPPCDKTIPTNKSIS